MTKPIAAVDRPLALRLRPDLIAVPVEMSGMTSWIVKDPVTLEHFQFSAEEYSLLERLRQPVSIGELQRGFSRQFPPQTVSPPAVWEFLSRLHSAGLLISDAEGQGLELLSQRRRERLRRWAWAWTELLAIRFRGIDPDMFLTALHNRCRWFFSPLAMLAATLLILLASSIVVGHFAEFVGRLPQLSALGDLRNVAWLLLAIGGVKVLHELGHALACKHFGGEVHELGFMLLAFSPCLYCDVTDAWRLTSKWQRIAVSAAGMAVELVLASLATILWWHSQSGVVNLLALDVMVVSTVGTLLVNGNPLLRYDGYYMLSDFVETPNLWQRSREALRKLATDWFMGQPVPDDPLVPAGHRPWLIAYALASKMYVAIVCVAIVWGLVILLFPLHLQNLAYVIGFTVLGSALAGPVGGAVRLARNPIRRSEVRTGRLALATTVMLAASVALLAMPVNYHVRAPLLILPEDAARVVATVDGTLASAAAAGQPIARGETIAELQNPDIAMEVRRLEGTRQLQSLRLTHLERLRGLDTAANDQIPAARAALDDLDRRLADRRQDAARLTLTAPIDGFVIPTPSVPTTNSHASRLGTWSGTLLDARSRGAQVEAGTLVCSVGDPARQCAVLLVDDTDINRLESGQAVRMRIDQLPGQVIEGEVVDVAGHEVREENTQAASRAELMPLLAGIVPPGHSATRYQVRVKFAATPQPLVIGGRGTAKVAAERITLARWIVRFLGHTFRLPM
ncbi:MAG: HlyD family efflux transporter periplasmic adaptor subunit [Planctomycetes bacterium]|nr:HlyD family efflux transporter periplasmic adaptor subunit [Planctomycetota bacterium]